MTIETSIAKEALFVATTQIDIREEGNNGGQAVTRYLKAVGLGAGYPWCMSFVYWCVDMASKKLGLPNPLVKTGGVLDQLARTKLRTLPSRSSAIKPGDIFIMDHGGGTGHTGFIDSIATGMFHTIEGNTNDEGSREGYEVCRRTRSINEIKAIIQLP